MTPNPCYGIAFQASGGPFGGCVYAPLNWVRAWPRETSGLVTWLVARLLTRWALAVAATARILDALAATIWACDVSRVCQAVNHN